MTEELDKMSVLDYVYNLETAALAHDAEIDCATTEINRLTAALREEQLNAEMLRERLDEAERKLPTVGYVMEMKARAKAAEDALIAEALEHEKRAAEEMACTYPYEYVVKYHLARARFCRMAAKGNK